MDCTKLFINIFLLVTVTNGAQIFAIVPMYGQSHWNVMDAVLQTLVRTGHNLTVVTPFIKKEKISNYTQIDSSPYLRRSASSPFEYIAGKNGIEYLTTYHQESCEAFYKSKDFWTALESNKYDLFITQLLGSGCDSYIANKLQVPMITVTSSAMLSSVISIFGNPWTTSYTSTLNAPLAVPETFWDRLINTYDFIHTNAQSWWYDRAATMIGRKYFGKDAPHAYELMKKISLVFVNSHFTFHQPNPWIPNLVEIGGIHVTNPKPLPKDVQQFINDTPDGVIYFSFGSTVKMDALPSNIQNALQEAFAELPQRILWKYDGEIMENKPKNVMIKKWFPQRDILAHPNMKLFVYHGGLSGMNEAIINQVPILGIPLFSDQFRNIANAVYLGIGLSLDYNSLDKHKFLLAAKEIINNEKYRNNVQKLYQRFKDRPMSPKALVTYWTEYVINHNGAEHVMSSAVTNLFWYQYYQLDVIMLIILFSTSLLLILLYTLIAIKNYILKRTNLIKSKLTKQT